MSWKMSPTIAYAAVRYTLAASGLALLGLSVTQAIAQGPTPQASSATAASSARVAPPLAPPPPLLEQTIPDTRSDKPSEEEWKQAVAVRPREMTAAATECDAKLLREYVRIRCPGPVAGYLHFLGNPDNLEARTPMMMADSRGLRPFAPEFKGLLDGTAIVRLTRGDVHHFQFLAFGDGYNGLTVEAGVFFEVLWLDGDRGPTVTVR